jgi:23S rRNA (cytosine1962-C5)-methyltransferase
MTFGESDFLPGLIIDRYQDYYAIQIQSAGFELMKNLVVDAILQINPVTKAIVLKSNSKSREIEGLSTEDELLYGTIPEIITIYDDNFELKLNLSKGQKTGYFLDQRFNRSFLSKIAHGKTVLDCFTNIGGFALSAAAGGATAITGVDISASAIELARQNAILNNFNINFVCDDVFDFLHSNADRKWDIIVLDPPAFAKNKKSVPTAKAAYTKLNKIAFSMLTPGGILLTASCSHHIYEDTFYSLVLDAAKKAGVRMNLVYRGSQASDHPIYTPMPETSYLKFFAFQIID